MQNSQHLLQNLIWPPSLSLSDVQRWHKQGFVFNSEPKIRFGLKQKSGGPCGVLAIVQGFIWRFLAFKSDDEVLKVDDIDDDTRNKFINEYKNILPENLSSTSSSSSTEDTNTHPANNKIKNPFFPTDSDRIRALSRSLAYIIWQSKPSGTGDRIPASVIICTILSPSKDSSSSSLVTDDSSVRNKMFSTDSLPQTNITASSANPSEHFQFNQFLSYSYSDTINYIEKNIEQYQSDYGLLLFVYSVVLTRGIDTIRKDMDDPDAYLTAQFGHCTQELMNLLIAGYAASQVHDGKLPVGDSGYFLRGIDDQPSIGYITYLESLRYCKVGTYLKRPMFPVWVVGSASHYTVVLALDTTFHHETPQESRISNIKRVFSRYDSTESGFVAISDLEKILNDLDIPVTSTVEMDLLRSKLNSGGSGVILMSEFIETIDPILVNIAQGIDMEIIKTIATGDSATVTANTHGFVNNNNNDNKNNDKISWNCNICTYFNTTFMSMLPPVTSNNVEVSCEVCNSVNNISELVQQKLMHITATNLDKNTYEDWNCSVCTMKNNGLVGDFKASCSMCGMVRKRNAMSNSNTSVSSSSKDANQSPWSCDICSFINTTQQETCEICNTKRATTTTGDGVYSDDTVKSFNMFHYNGMRRKIHGNDVPPSVCSVIITVNPLMGNHPPSDPLNDVLRTIWPSATLNWNNKPVPSIDG